MLNMDNKRKRKCTIKASTSSKSEIISKNQLSSKENPLQKKVSRSSVKRIKKHTKSSTNTYDINCKSIEAQEAVIAKNGAGKQVHKRRKQVSKSEKECGISENVEENINEEPSKKKSRTTTYKHITKRTLISDKEIPKAVSQGNHQSPDSGIIANENSSESEWEEVQERNTMTELDDYNPKIPKDGVEITISTNAWLRKRCQKKEIDLTDIIRRQVNRFKKDIQVALHKVHLLCLLAHGQFLNSVLLQEELLAIMFSIVPMEFHKLKVITLETVNKLVLWLHQHFHNHSYDCNWKVSVRDALKKTIQDGQVSNPKDFSMLFVLALRSLGFETRLCLSVHPIQLKCGKIEKKGNKNSKVKQEVSDKKSKLDNGKDSSSPIKRETNRKHTVKRSVKNRTANSEKNKYKVTKLLKSEDDTNSSGDDFEIHSYGSRLSGKAKVLMQDSSDAIDYNKGDFIVTQAKPGCKSKFSVPDVNETSTVKRKKKLPNRKILSSDDSDEDNAKVCVTDTENNGIDYWAEIYMKEEGKLKWICVDCVNNIVENPYGIEKDAVQPITYVIAFDNDNCVKDVTKRYASKWMTYTRKIRTDEMWWEESLAPFLSRNHKRNKNEDVHLDEVMATMPLPTTIGAFKDHPLYVLQRHLLKFQAIYPADAPPLGYIRNEAVYARECVHTLHSRETWLKQARVVRIGEEPYKIVKARPKWNKAIGEIQTDLPLEIFGKWQTEEYIPPVAENGKVPRNEYGNVELFQSSMLPIGTVHLQIPGLNRVARKLNIDCCPALVGFDGNWGNVHPVFDGWIVCEEFKEVLIAAWDEDQENQQKRENEKREKRIYGNWKRLIKGLLIREKLRYKYDPAK